MLYLFSEVSFKKYRVERMSMTIMMAQTLTTSFIFVSSEMTMADWQIGRCRLVSCKESTSREVCALSEFFVGGGQTQRVHTVHKIIILQLQI